jgi:hypothetical protein
MKKGLAIEAVDATHVESTWRDLEHRLSSSSVPPVATRPVDAVTLLERVQALGGEMARAKAPSALERRRRELVAALERELRAEDSASRGEAAQRGTGRVVELIRDDVHLAAKLRERVAKLRTRLDGAAGDLVEDALRSLRGRLDGLLRQARLGKIDAVVGYKRKLERQIENLAAGRFPAEMFNRLHLEGLIGDDEEYWPPEQEKWADEYENYK